MMKLVDINQTIRYLGRKCFEHVWYYTFTDGKGGIMMYPAVKVRVDRRVFYGEDASSIDLHEYDERKDKSLQLGL